MLSSVTVIHHVIVAFCQLRVLLSELVTRPVFFMSPSKAHPAALSVAADDHVALLLILTTGQLGVLLGEREAP